MLYLDTSAAVSIFLTEARTARVAELVGAPGTIIVISDFTAGELSAAIGTAVRVRRQTELEGREAIADFDEWYSTSVRQVAVTTPDIHASIKLVRRFELALLFPDALHLAICRRVSTTLVTGDRQQASAAEMLGISTIRV